MMTEREALTEFLEAYKFLPCLWDQNNELYTSKIERQRGYEILHEKLKKYDKSVTLMETKKKLDHMRSSYKREAKKVIEARKRGNEHLPILWYYKLLTFLEQEREPQDGNNDDGAIVYEGSSEGSFLKYALLESKKGECPAKRIKTDVDDEEDEWQADGEPYIEENPNFITIKEDLFVQDSSSNVAVDQQDELLDKETDSFGKTISYQLKQLNSMQRTFAEKLISDVIFHGRLNKLNMESTLNVKE